jgi:effector-binding domain-containing protein
MISAKTISKLALVMVSSLFVSACSVIGIRSGTAEPPFVALDRLGQIEIRSYGPLLAADTIVEGAEEDALNVGFSRLADYIFGNNSSARDIDMTVPVAKSSEQIAMTAPVVRESLEDGRYRIRFFMPSSYDLASLPQPNSREIEIVAIPEQQYAVIRYSGNYSITSSMERQNELLSAIAATPWQVSGPVSTWFYDPPWTIPWLRRNEAAVPISR